jgi:alpha-glucosidase
MDIKLRFVKIHLSVIFFILASLDMRGNDTLKICSPSGKICVHIWMEKNVKYRIYENDLPLFGISEADMLLSNQTSFSVNNQILSHSTISVADEIISPVPEKRKKIQDRYNQIAIRFKQPYRMEFRVYDDGVAYRFQTAFKDSVTVEKEVADFHFNAKDSIYYPGIHKRDDADIFHTSYEEHFPLREMDEIRTHELAYNPALVKLLSGVKIGITESDLEDYPGMFLAGTGTGVLRGLFAPYPLEEKMTGGEYPQSVVTKRADYIAKTKGTRSFPWRIFIIADQDRQLPSNDIVYRLASPSRIGDPSWIKPGKGTDEWTINVNLFNVPFRSGVNTASYKYYIDFAKRFGFDRIMMDAGWSENTDLFKINPDINMDTLVVYARERGIKISMWTLAHSLDRQLDSALDRFNKWGVDFIMTDFIDRDDQKTVNFYYRIAEACAKHHIMIMYHGAYPPKGFNRTYPNNITREGVLGSEYNIGSDLASPDHDLMLPYTRMLAGSFDYEPGILNNATKKGFRAIEGMVMSQGTRCHQLAMFIVYDNPMEIFAGNPSQGLLEPRFMELMGSLPTTWDETNILNGKVGEYIVTSRLKGNSWYIGGMSNWTARDVTIKFDFLEGDHPYKATICKDGVNADRYAADYILSDTWIKKDDQMTLHMAPGGGFLIRIEK